METVNDPFLRHLFDGETVFNVYNNEVTNLSVGAPGPDLLKNCGNMMMQATRHRMVIFNLKYTFNTLNPLQINTTSKLKLKKNNYRTHQEH